MTEADRIPLNRLRDEATARFIGQGGVVGVGVGRANQLTVLLASHDERQEEEIRRWADERSVAVEMLVTGILRTA